MSSKNQMPDSAPTETSIKEKDIRDNPQQMEKDYENYNNIITQNSAKINSNDKNDKIKLHIDTVRFSQKPEDTVTKQAIKPRMQINTPPVSVTIPELLERISQGYTISPAVMSGGAKAENWKEQQLFCVDIDNKDNSKPFLQPEEAGKICEKHNIPLAFYYFSFSHFVETAKETARPKFRLGFVLNEVITDEDKRFAVMTSLISIFRDWADTSCDNADRFFYGTDKGCEIINLDEYADYETIISAFVPPTEELESDNRIKNNYKADFKDDDLDRLKRDFDFFSYLQSRNGGYKNISGGAMFDKCEICGHFNDLVYYKSTNTFYCFGANGGRGGSIIDYLMLANKLSLADAISKFKHELCGIPRNNAPPNNTEPKSKPTQAEILLKFVSESGAEFFSDEISDLYAAIPIDGHTEILLIERRDFLQWLQGLYFKHTRKSISGDALAQATGVLCAKARFEGGEPKKLNVRIAHYDGAFWYDLTNSAWEAVRITPDGWQFIKNPPIMFNRYRHQTAQVRPLTSGRADKILNYINLKTNHILFLCWLISCFVPGIPHAMPLFYGEKGAAKSTACELVKLIIDPSALATLTLLNDLRTLAVTLQQHHFLAFDNVSYINDETSDILCRAITGSGIQQRKLHSNGDDYIFTFQRCISLNGINCAASRSDLLDRAILIELERITETDRRELSEVMRNFEADRAEILGGIFGTLAEAMKIYPSVKLDALPRMADFTRWGYAIGEALGGFGQSFLAEYAANRAIQNQEAINSDSVATLIVEFMREREKWSGSASNLYSELTHEAVKHNINTRSKSFPVDPARLSKRLNGIKSNLEMAGITLNKDRTGNDRNIQISRTT